MTPPGDGPGPLLIAAVILAVLVALFFLAWSLGLWKRFVPVARMRGVKDVLVPTLWIAAALVVSIGLVWGAQTYEKHQRDAAWDRYEQYQRQHGAGS